MNPIIPLAAFGGLVGLYAYKKGHPSPAAKLAAVQKQQGSYLQASWDTHLSVQDVQHDLNALGASPKLDEDGVLGPKTTAAIKSFQAQAGIAVDGVVGPQTTIALNHAVGGPSQTAAGQFFLLEGEETYDAVGASQVEAIDRSRPGRGVKYAIEGTSAVGAGGGDSSSWSAPSAQDILNDPQQRMQIGLLKMAQAKAQAAFPGSKAAGYDYSFLPDGGASEMMEATTAWCGAEADRQAALNAVSGAYEDDEENGVAGAYEDDEEYGVAGAYEDDEEFGVAGEYDEEEEFYTGAECWSAPDIAEAYADPVQQAEHAAMYGYPQPYGQMPYEYGYEQPQQPMMGWNQPPFLPYPTSNQGYYAQPQQMGVVSAMPTGIGVVPGQGYQFQSQPGRKF